MNKYKSLITFSIILSIISSISAIIGYTLGYFHGTDERIDASECKPIRYWYFR